VEKGVFCRVCQARITTQEHSVSINGRHLHAFFNPAGIAFEIRCFRSAAGTVGQGPMSSDFTWFPGYSWQIALCSVCQVHLGWRFVDTTASHHFYGLIVSRLFEK
jgi:hypothetical protein